MDKFKIIILIALLAAIAIFVFLPINDYFNGQRDYSIDVPMKYGADYFTAEISSPNFFKPQAIKTPTHLPYTIKGSDYKTTVLEFHITYYSASISEVVINGASETPVFNKVGETSFKIVLPN